MLAERNKRPVLDRWQKIFSQDADTCSSVDFQQLTIEQDDGGGGPFWRIQTQQWAISSIAELVSVLREAGVAETNPGDQE